MAFGVTEYAWITAAPVLAVESKSKQPLSQPFKLTRQEATDARLGIETDKIKEEHVTTTRIRHTSRNNITVQGEISRALEQAKPKKSLTTPNRQRTLQSICKLITSHRTEVKGARLAITRNFDSVKSQFIDADVLA